MRSDKLVVVAAISGFALGQLGLLNPVSGQAQAVKPAVVWEVKELFGNGYDGDNHHLLKHEGHEGWELATAVRCSEAKGTFKLRYTFKRPRPS